MLSQEQEHTCKPLMQTKISFAVLLVVIDENWPYFELQIELNTLPHTKTPLMLRWIQVYWL